MRKVALHVRNGVVCSIGKGGERKGTGRIGVEAVTWVWEKRRPLDPEWEREREGDIQGKKERKKEEEKGLLRLFLLFLPPPAIRT